MCSSDLVGKPSQTAELRRRVFRKAAEFHPIVANLESVLDHPEELTKERIATEEKMTWPELELRLFADIIEQHRLTKFEGPMDSVELLARYNVAQTQAALLDAQQVVVEASTDWKPILRFAKLANLLHRIEPWGEGYRITLDGPASVLRNTHRYGVQMAKFLPGLLSCSGWSMRAKLCPRRLSRSANAPWMRDRSWVLSLDDQSGLQSGVASPLLIDSEVEQDLMDAWELMRRLLPPEDRESRWELQREGDLLVRGQRVFFPDFTIFNPEGESILLEVVGFWTPEYIAHKKEVLEIFAESSLLLAIPQSLKSEWKSHRFAPNHRVLYYQRALLPGEIIRAIEGNG